MFVGYGYGTSGHVWVTRRRWLARLLDLRPTLLPEVAVAPRCRLEREINGEMLRRARYCARF